MVDESAADPALARMAAIAEVVNKFNDPSLQMRAFEALAGEHFSPAPLRTQTKSAPAFVARDADVVDLDIDGQEDAPAGGKKPASKKSSSKKIQLVVPKDINFAPGDVISLSEFVQAKAPSTNGEKLLCAAYYLKTHLGRTVKAGDVMAVFVAASWSRPANPVNALQVVASTKHWLDTKNMDDIKVTWAGENYVDDKLPKSPR